MKKPKLSEKQEYEVYRGLLHLVQKDTCESKYLISKNKINEAVSSLKDAYNLLERANRLNYFPENMIRFLSVRYNAVVLNPKIQKHPDKPCGFGIEVDKFKDIFTEKELDSMVNKLEGLLNPQVFSILRR